MVNCNNFALRNATEVNGIVSREISDVVIWQTEGRAYRI
jgi:hypothetical protein